MSIDQRFTSHFSGKTVIVTGAAGFLGSHLSEWMLKNGARVVGFDNFVTGQQKNIELLKQLGGDNFVFHERNVAEKLDDILNTETQVDYVFHFASPASPPRYQEQPILTYQVNSFGTHYLLEYLQRRHPSSRFIFASTSEVYGNPEIHPQPETYWGNVNPNGPRACYDEAKRLGETICGVFHRDFGMDVRIVRIFNTYGPRMNPIDGRVIVDFVKQALKNEKISIFGDGSQTRSYCYVDDLVKGILLLATGEGLSGETVNLGNPDEYTVMDTAKIISQTINPGANFESQLQFSSLPKDDPLRRKPDVHKAKEMLGWTPEVSFEAGLAQTIEYFRTEV